MIRIEDYEIAAGQTFPDGTLSLKMPAIGDLNISVSWLYESDAELFTLICVKRHIDENYPDVETVLYMPYCPHARMDRVKSHTDVFTLKYFCEVINSLNFRSVFIFDAHSYVAPALLDRVINLSPADDIKTAMRRITQINPNAQICPFYPDEGAMKRYSEMFKLPYAYGIKKRNWETGKLQSLELVYPENVVGKDILIIDDICSKGGTFIMAAKALKEAGAANIYLYVSHCENTIFKGEIFTSGLIKTVFTTESIFPVDKQAINMIEVLDYYEEK